MVYGITLWGKRFIEAIESVIDRGRLQRGKTYANTGRVRDLEIKGTKASAVVDGSGRNLYKVHITFIPLDKAQKETVYRVINENPLILASILNGQLPLELEDLLIDEGVYIFPDSWSEMARQCSCPDWSDPCKHMAAVYFTLATAIDRNPFIIFELNGVDLKKHFHIEEKDTEIEPLISPVIVENTYKPEKDSITIEPLKDSKNFILSLLTDNPPFFYKNYKEAFIDFYTKNSKGYASVFYPAVSSNMHHIEQIFKESDINVVIMKNFKKSYITVSNHIFKDNERTISFFDDFNVVLKSGKLQLGFFECARFFIAFKDDDGGEEYKFLYYLFRFAYMIIEANAFIPDVDAGKKDFRILYKPLFSIEKIRETIENLSHLSPSMVEVSKQHVERKSSTELILIAFLTEYVEKFNYMHSFLKNNPPDISRAFFRGEGILTDKIDLKELPYAVKNWLSPFDIVKSSYKYMICLDKQDEYYLSILVQISGENITIREALSQSESPVILKFLGFLSSYIRGVNVFFDEDYLVVTEDELENFVLNTSYTLSNLGVEIILPKELRALLKPKLVLSASSSKPSGFTSYLDLSSMLDYEWKVAIGDKYISVEDFENLTKHGRELVKFNDIFVRITPEEVKRLLGGADKKKLSSLDLIQAKLTDELELDEETNFVIDNLFRFDNIDIPQELNANLRPYQEYGYRWAVNNLLNGFGVILADDMGLGKTIQAITVILHLKSAGKITRPVLVVAPMTLLNNWQNELEKFAPSLKVAIYHGKGREFEDGVEIYITTYSTVMRDEEIIKKNKFDVIIIDEAQYIKNNNTKTTKAVKSIKTSYKIALSGTPVENNLSELWSIFDFAIPKYLKSLSVFQKEFAKDIEIRRDTEKIEKLKDLTSPFMLRRLKTDKNIIDDLPDKIIIDEYSTLSPEQASLYQGVVDSTLEMIEMSEGIDRKGLIFKLITSLKQICNHPANYDSNYSVDFNLSGKLQMLLVLLESILEKDEKVIIFTQYTKMAEILCETIEKEFFSTPLYLHGGLSRKRRNELVDLFQSGKKHPVFVLSLKAAGTGLNLTAASRVIHYDLWFNPAVENQATDRAFRIGQKKNVFVHRFVTKNTFEEKIDAMIKSKKELSDLSISSSEKWISELDNDQLNNLLW